MGALVWFRNDLRTVDNTALHEACRAADWVIGVFLLAPRQWEEHDWGAVKVDFVLRTLDRLRERLDELGIPLLVLDAPRFAAAPRVLLRLAREHGADALYFNREYEVNELARDRAVERACAASGVRSVACDDQTVLPPDRLRTGAGGYFKVFTPFRRAWYREIERDGLPAPLPRPTARRRPPPVSDAVPRTVRGFERSPVDAATWRAGEVEAQRRLDHFVDERIERYRQDRDFPAVDGTSTLSPYLACGAISPRQCLAAAAEANTGWLDAGREGVTTWISELIWREFYRHVLVGFPHVCRHRAFRPETDRIDWSHDEERFAAWCEGRCGVPIVDAAMRQLLHIGWMHNRLRMIVAMYLSKNLFIDWRWGERFFMGRLIDGDFASNNGGWQWSASTGCDAAPYFRMFNPVRQSERWDGDGRFVRRYCPELAELDRRALHDPSRLPPLERQALDYPRPLVGPTQARQRVIAAFRGLR